MFSIYSLLAIYMLQEYFQVYALKTKNFDSKLAITYILLLKVLKFMKSAKIILNSYDY